jgi:DNA-binding HxlR family transcriptional regulator
VSRADEGYNEKTHSAVSLLCGKWKLRILVSMKNGPVRVSELQRLIPEATKKMLIDTLHSLETAGIVIRTDVGGSIRHVEYRIVGVLEESTQALLGQLAHWSDLTRSVRNERSENASSNNRPNNVP